MDTRDLMNGGEKNPDADLQATDRARYSLDYKSGGIAVATSPKSGASKADYNLAIAATGARTNPNYKYKNYEGSIETVENDPDVLDRINDPRYDPEYQKFAGQLREIYNDHNYRWKGFLHELYPTFSKLLLAFDPDNKYNVTPESLGKLCSKKLDELDKTGKVDKKFKPEDFK